MKDPRVTIDTRDDKNSSLGGGSENSSIPIHTMRAGWTPKTRKSTVEMIHLGHMWPVARMDPKSDKFNYGNDQFGTHLRHRTYGPQK